MSGMLEEKLEERLEKWLRCQHSEKVLITWWPKRLLKLVSEEELHREEKEWQ